MDSIYFEKQESLMCGQHALNNLLQGNYFSAANLSEIAQELDEQEHSVLSPSARESKSNNVNDFGFFSIQVMSKALERLSLELTNISHPNMAHVKKDPLLANAFICNRQEHWFVIRKFGTQWFEINSTQEGPQLRTDTHIGLILDNYCTSGYTILVVVGNLPDCRAQEIISANPVMPFREERKKTGGEVHKENKKPESFSGKGARLGGSPQEEEDDELQRAIALSLGGTSQEEDDLAVALMLSLEEFELSFRDHDSPSTSAAASGFEDDEDRQLQLALAASLQSEQSDFPSTSAASASRAEQLRNIRGRFLDNLEKKH